MKESRIEILEHNLRVEEFNLRQALLRVLPEFVSIRSNVFTSAEFNPSNLPSHMFHPQAEKLLKSARLCIRLRQELGLESDKNIASEYLSACEENASEDEHRRGPRKLSEYLLNYIHNGT